MWSPCAGRDCREWMTQMPKIQFMSITTHYYILLHTSPWHSLSLLCLRSLSTRTSWKGGSIRFAHHLHTLEASGSGWRYGDHPVRLSQWLSQQCPHLPPLPCQRWFKEAERSWRLLPYVLCEFLGAGLVPRPWSAMKCSVWRQDNCYYTLLHIILYYHIFYYYVLLHYLFLHC